MGLQTLVDVFEGYFFGRFCGDFFQGRCRNSLWNESIVVLAYVMLQYVRKWILPSDYRVFHIGENLFLTAAFLFLLILVFYRNVGAVSVFLVVSFMVIQESCRILTLIIPYMADVLTGIGGRQGERGNLLFTVLIVDGVWILAYAARVAVMYVSLKSIRGNFREKRRHFHSVELQCLLMPGLAGLGFLVLLNLMMFRVGEGGEQEFLFDVYPVLRLSVPVMLALVLLSVLYGVRLFQDMLLLNRERNSRAVLERQIKSMREYMEETERVQSGLRGIRHDMKNTLAVLMELTAREQGREELRRYLSGFHQAVSSLECRFHTGNAVADALLNRKYHEAVKEIPDLEMDAGELVFPDSWAIESYDLGIIVGNALDNGVSACRELKAENPEAKVYVRLSSFQRRNMFFLEVENSFNGRLRLEKGARFPVSRKEDGQSHGMGMANIKYAAEKYHGAVEWEVRGMCFVLSVMLENV